jgi:uncharacterized phiE125 gp8 family phage protein
MKISKAAITTYPISYLEAKAHLRLDSDVEKSYVDMLIAAVTAYAETEIETTLASRAITVTHYDCNKYGPNKYLVPQGPVNSITSVTDGRGTLLSVTGYDVIHEGHQTFVVIDDATYEPASHDYPLVIVYSAGLATIPADIKLALLIHLATLYQNREGVLTGTVTDVEFSLKSIYHHHRRSEFVG